MHLCRDASSQVFKRDDWSGLRLRQRILNKSTHKPHEELGTSNMIFIVFCNNIANSTWTKTAVAVAEELVPFGVATAHYRGCSSTYRIAEIFEEKKRVGTRKLAVCTGALVSFQGPIWT